MDIQSEYDVLTVCVMLLVFALPLSLLVPNFTVWDVIPKVQVYRFHVYSQHLTWPQLNAAVLTILFFLFCLYLELRKRKMDDMVESVLTVSQNTDKTMLTERERQIAAARVCVELLDASAEHYEHLVLLRDDLRLRKQHPPTIEPSSNSM